MTLDRRGFIAGAALGTGGFALVSPAIAQNPSPSRAAASPLPSEGVLLHRQTYLVPATIEQTWSALTDPAKRQIWFGYGRGAKPEPLPAGPPPYVQRSVVDHPGLPGPTETIVVLEPAEGGTAITQTMTGLGGKEVWRNSVDPGGGIAEMMGDLALYLRTGVGFPRHTHVALPTKRPHPNDFLAGSRNFPGGVEILDVPPRTLGAQVGMKPGDVLVALGDTGIYNLRDLDVARLGLAPGDTVEVAWVRADKVMRGVGQMTSTPIKWRNGFDPAKAVKANNQRRDTR